MNSKQSELCKVLEEEGRVDLVLEIKKEFTNCEGCSKCCNYVIFELACDLNYSYLLYLLYHNIHLFVDKESKEIDALVENSCSKLKNNKCSIYENKPDICNSYANLICLEKKREDSILVIKTVEELESNKELILSIIEDS